MARTGTVLLVSPAKIGGKVWPVGSSPEVTGEIALQLAEVGAIEAKPAEIAQAKDALAKAAKASTENVGQIVDLMRADKAGTLKTKAGNWSPAAIGKALGRDVSAEEIEAAATAAALEE